MTNAAPLHRFHIPSSCEESQVYVHAVSDARCVFDMGVSDDFMKCITFHLL